MFQLFLIAVLEFQCPNLGQIETDVRLRQIFSLNLRRSTVCTRAKIQRKPGQPRKYVRKFVTKNGRDKIG